jgi:flagellar operon protein
LDRFDQVLQQHLTGGVQFSGHAQTRLSARGIEVSADQMRQLEGAVALAREKGACETLVLLGGQAFIVDVTAAKVVTAMPAQGGKIFTNIDSTVVI